MDIELEFFRDYKFKGNIYTKCTSDFYTGEIKYILFEHKTAHSDKKGDLEEKIIISEKKENANKLVCFSNLPISVYSVSAFIGEKKLHSAKMDIPSTSISMASINIPTPNLKGGLKLDSKEHNTLSVMFFPDGFNCLQALQEKSPQAVPIYTKWKDKIKFVQSFNPKDIEKKIEFYSQFEQCFNIFDVETDLSDEELLSLAKELESHIFVKYCSLSIDPDYFIPPSEVNDLAFNAENNSITDTPDFSSKQGYLDEGVGMNVRAAWKNGVTGKGATVRHLDFGVYHAHEDLKGNITVINSRAGDCNHGTASTGCIAAIGNDYGVTGIAHNCHFFFYDTGDLNKIVRDVEPGDIISIDNQFKLGSYYVPMVHSKDYWNKFKLCVDAGAIVIYAGGNGGQNLKSLAPFNNWGSSGAIMIGACHSENGRKISASNYNHDKVINSWGMKVTTTGYGDLQRVEGSNRNYTSSYSGTSSATPLVAGALALIQSYAKTKYHVVFNAFDMHQIIEESGYKDAKGEDIGYRPNVIEALKRVDEKMIPFVPALPLWNKDKEYDNYGHEVSWANKNWANKNWVKGTEPGTERGQDDCPWVEIGSNEYIKEWWVVKKPLSQAKST